MLTRKKSSTSQKPRKKLKTADLEEISPQVNNISDLINLSDSLKIYKNIDTLMLWRITPHLKELNSMIGMESLKETLFYQIIYYLQKMHSQNLNNEYLHTVIYDSPGCGKLQLLK